jgi:hypothetical protein
VWQDADDVDISRALFRQRFQITVQRRLLGIDLSHLEAEQVLADDERLEAAYLQWWTRTMAGRP